jgi:limonene-1,2-epoxide hydrolase
MSNEEAVVRRVIEMWETTESTIRAYREHHTPNLHWWNSARGSVHGAEACIEKVKMMHAKLNLGCVKGVIRNLVARDGIVMVERTDDLYRKDGSLIVSIPVTGVAEFEGDKISEWRDYCVDWYTSYSRQQVASPTP